MWHRAKTLNKLTLRNVFFWEGGGGCFALPPRVEFLRRLDQRGHCHWPLFLTGWGCTKFYQGGVPTLIRLGKVSCRQKGHIGQSRHSWQVFIFIYFYRFFSGGGEWGRTKFYQGRVHTSLISEKVSCRQKGHCHWPVLSFLTGWAWSITSRGGFLFANPVTLHTTSLPT